MKIKKIERLSHKEDTGCLTIKDPGNNHNFAVCAGVFVKNSADGRGSQIDTIGGNFSAFSELDDIHYFQKKLYRSLKYPMSRVTQMHENRDSDIMFGGGRMGEITRDEIKWAKFLERQQNRMCAELKEIFLLHLDFKGIKAQYELNRSSFDIKFNPPNWYTEEMNQMALEQRVSNYTSLSREAEFPKTYLMNKYMKMTEDDFKEMKSYEEMDKKYLPKDDEGGSW